MSAGVFIMVAALSMGTLYFLLYLDFPSLALHRPSVRPRGNLVFFPTPAGRRRRRRRAEQQRATRAARQARASRLARAHGERRRHPFGTPKAH